MTKGFDYKGYKIEIASENNGFIVEIEPQKCSLPRLRWRTFDICSGSEEEALAEARQRIDEAFDAAQD